MMKKLESRNFNVVIENNDYIIKTGKSNKINCEYQWLEHVNQMLGPNDLFPDVKLEKTGTYSYLKIHGKILADVFRREGISEQKQIDIIQKVLKLTQTYQRGNVSVKHAEELARQVYLTNTMKRLQNWYKFESVKMQPIYVNKVKIPPFIEIKPKFDRLIHKNLLQNINRYWGIIHGDLNFTNIIINKSKIHFIDPKGSFGGAPSLFGDTRYDLAKLRQCYEGNYDLIALKRVKIRKSDNGLTILLPPVLSLKTVNKMDCILSQFALAKEFKLIEAIQFFSMIPLHNEDENAQLYFYSKAMALAWNLISQTKSEDNNKVEIFVNGD